MGHIYKWLGSMEQVKELWQNKESLEKYIDRLRELMEEDSQGKIESPDNEEKLNQEFSKSSIFRTHR